MNGRSIEVPEPLPSQIRVPVEPDHTPWSWPEAAPTIQYRLIRKRRGAEQWHEYCVESEPRRAPVTDLVFTQSRLRVDCAQLLQDIGDLITSEMGVPPEFMAQGATIRTSDELGGWGQLRRYGSPWTEFFPQPQPGFGIPTFDIGCRRSDGGAPNFAPMMSFKEFGQKDHLVWKEWIKRNPR